MAKKPPKDLIVESSDGLLYVRVDAIMSPIIPIIDGLPIALFGKGKRAYLSFDTAIEWCKEEMKYHSEQKYKDIIANLERIRSEAKPAE